MRGRSLLAGRGRTPPFTGRGFFVDVRIGIA